MLNEIKIITNVEKLEIPKVLDEDYTKLKDYYDYKIKQWETLEFSKITYLSDDLKVKGFVIEPKLKPENPLPCFIYNRGGSGEYGIIDEQKLFQELAEFASWGYIVIASQYRGNDGGEGKDEYCGSDLNDVINLKIVIDNHPNIDKTKIAMYGASRGGLMTYAAMSEVDWIKCAVIKAGSTDEIRGYEERPELKEFRESMYDVNSEFENIKRSPLRWSEEKIKSIKGPFLLLHGTNDIQVNTLDSLEMAIRLYKNKVPFEMAIYMNDDHRLRKSKFEVQSKMKKWLERNLL